MPKLQPTLRPSLVALYWQLRDRHVQRSPSQQQRFGRRYGATKTSIRRQLLASRSSSMSRLDQHCSSFRFFRNLSGQARIYQWRKFARNPRLDCGLLCCPVDPLLQSLVVAPLVLAAPRWHLSSGQARRLHQGCRRRSYRSRCRQLRRALHSLVFVALRVPAAVVVAEAVELVVPIVSVKSAEIVAGLAFRIGLLSSPRTDLAEVLEVQAVLPTVQSVLLLVLPVVHPNPSG